MALITLFMGLSMVIIDVTIINIVLPNMAQNLKGNITWLQWAVNGYILTFAGFLLSTGNWGDRVGPKVAFLRGLILFIFASLGGALSTAFEILIFFSLLQAGGAALLVSSSLSLIHTSYEDKHQRAKAIGFWATLGSIVAAIGPLLGGFLTLWFRWRAVFLINIPIGIIVLLLSLKYLPNTLGAIAIFNQMVSEYYIKVMM